MIFEIEKLKLTMPYLSGLYYLHHSNQSRMAYHENNILAEVILQYPGTLQILERFGIPLGLGNDTIDVVCERHEVLPNLFTLVLNVSTFPEYVPQSGKSYDFIPQLLRYLSSSHRYFTEIKIPQVDDDVNRLILELGDNKARALSHLFKHYIAEVSEHIQYENETVFKYIQELYSCYQKQQLPDQSVSYHIGVYGAHHDDIESVLMDVKNILIRHIPQTEKGPLRRKILHQLFELERDLYSHTRLENEVLIPIVQHLEAEINPI